MSTSSELSSYSSASSSFESTEASGSDFSEPTVSQSSAADVMSQDYNESSHGLSPTLAKLARVLPVLVLIVGFLTIAACVITVLADDVYIGDIPWPYISDTGRDPPAYYIFSIGSTINAILIAVTMFLNYKMVSARVAALALDWSKSPIIINAIGAVSGIPLALLAILDTVNYPDAHQYAAYAFFVLMVIFIISNTVLYRKIAKRDPEDGALQKSVLVKLITALCCFVFVVIYLGTAAAVTFERLTIAKCLSKNLGNDYCTNEMKLNDTETKLWDYSNEKTMNTLRAVFQHLSVLSIFIYVATMAYDGAKSKSIGASNATPQLVKGREMDSPV